MTTPDEAVEPVATLIPVFDFIFDPPSQFTQVTLDANVLPVYTFLHPRFGPISILLSEKTIRFLYEQTSSLLNKVRH